MAGSRTDRSYSAPLSTRLRRHAGVMAGVPRVWGCVGWIRIANSTLRSPPVLSAATSYPRRSRIESLYVNPWSLTDNAVTTARRLAEPALSEHGSFVAGGGFAASRFSFRLSESRNAVYDFDYVDVRGVDVIMWSVFCNMNERVSAVRRNGAGGWLVARVLLRRSSTFRPGVYT